MYKLRSRFVDTGPIGDANPDIVLATVIVEGRPMEEDMPDEKLLTPAIDVDIHPTAEELAAMPVTKRRKFVFSSDDNGFYINGKLFDPNRDDVVVKLGAVEEWEIVNVTGEKHVFHMHQLNFLVKTVSGSTRDVATLRDTMDIPFQRGHRPGRLLIKLAFTNPYMIGRFPFHCHILEHEDGGMMQNLRVVP
jgi:FtsP/CotA-like multicopper oxidase with cupredoxin domain